MRNLLVTGLVLGMTVAMSGGVWAAGAATPVSAVKAVVRTMTPENNACYPRNTGSWYLPERGCPVTARFSHRLRTAPSRDVDLICRCQNVARMRYATRRQGNMAYVTATFAFNTPLRITFVVVHRHGRWLVDNTYCAGRPRTSIYRSPIPPCA